MKSQANWLIGAVLAALLVLMASAQTGSVPKHKPLMMSRLYTGPDGQTQRCSAYALPAARNTECWP